MKKSLFVVLAALSATSALAASTGSLEVATWLDNGPETGLTGSIVVPQFQIGDEDGKLVGESGATVYLERQPGGYQGFVDGRPFNIVCTATACTDNGSTQLNLTITPVTGGYKLDGMLNYVSVHALVTTAKISVSVMGSSNDEGFELNRQSDGSYAGEGDAQAAYQFQITATGTGSLAGVMDPATFVVLMISPFMVD